jgi:hypothetical protein
MDITFKIPLAELMDKLDLEHYHDEAEEVHVEQDDDQDGAVTIKIVGFKS